MTRQQLRRLLVQQRRYVTDHKKSHTILTEYVYGRPRIYTSLQTIAKAKPATASKSRVGSPLTSPLSWRWLQPSDKALASSLSTEISTEDDKLQHDRSNPSMIAHAFGSVKQSLREMFLPVGYPESVHGCYKRFHLWLSLETYVGSAVGVLCSQAMLASLGLGAAEAAGGAVAIQWVLKDGIGEFGKLFFIKQFASSFDSHPKTWKFAIGNVFNLVHESIWLASHMTFTKQFAINGNIGDIVAKDDAQMSTAHLLGMLTGVGVISLSHEPLYLFGAFGILTPINMWSTYKMLKTAEFEVLNQAKLTLLSRSFIDHGRAESCSELRPREIGFGEWIRPGAHVSIHLKLGASADQAYDSVGEVQTSTRVFNSENYLLSYRKGTMNVLFHEDAEAEDVVQSVLHAMKFHDTLVHQNINKESNWSAYVAALDDSLAWTKENTPRFLDALAQKGWQKNVVYWNDAGMRVSWEGHPSSQQRQHHQSSTIDT
ncbi:vitamin B6 photo-protection and homoeostasis-domain-containing protein [Dichotomocladium elegans]|nr:vitamin B6 photo-protection and homoeostasis-domain-containing protein [Dichotomocladium elegans]